jgi:hypothetical protein
MTPGQELASALGELPEVRLEPMNGGALGVSWNDGGKPRQVAVREAGELLVIVAGVCREEDTSPRRVLAAAAFLNGSGAALIRGKVVLRHVLPRDRRDPASVREAVTTLSATARRFRRAVTGSRGGDDDAMFDHYES